MQFKRGHNAWQGWTCMVVKVESCLHFLRLAESMMAFHSTSAQVETSTPPLPYKSDKKMTSMRWKSLKFTSY